VVAVVATVRAWLNVTFTLGRGTRLEFLPGDEQCTDTRLTRYAGPSYSSAITGLLDAGLSCVRTIPSYGIFLERENLKVIE
jgi:hypothetical protein